MLAHVAEELHQRLLPQPVGVVEDHRRLDAGRPQQPPDLDAEAVDVRLRCGVVEERALDLPARRVPDEPRPPAQERDGTVPRPREVRQQHHRVEAPRVEARGRRVEPDIGDDLLLRGERAEGLVGHLVDEPPLAEGGDQVAALRIHRSPSGGPAAARASQASGVHRSASRSPPR